MKHFKQAALLLCLLAFNPNSSYSAEGSRQSATVEAVLAGDTVRLKGGRVLKYSGVDTYSPESKIPLSREYGVRALEFNHKLVNGKKIGIEWGPKLRDKQNRLLGYVFTEDGAFVNEVLLREGQAKAHIVIPNTRYADKFREWEGLARKAKKGIWEQEPYDPNASTKIIGEKNTKIYYYPDSPELERIPEAQWVVFRSRVDAKAAGYRACFTCRQKGEFDESE